MPRPFREKTGASSVDGPEGEELMTDPITYVRAKDGRYAPTDKDTLHSEALADVQAHQDGRRATVGDLTLDEVVADWVIGIELVAEEVALIKAHPVEVKELLQDHQVRLHACFSQLKQVRRRDG